MPKSRGGGVTEAQVHLADLLTDGISAAPDYVEACQWLLLAAQAENRLAQIRLRSVEKNSASPSSKKPSEERLPSPNAWPKKPRGRSEPRTAQSDPEQDPDPQGL